MNSSKNKPSLEDLFISRKLSSPRPESWSDFEKGKNQNFESFQRHTTTSLREISPSTSHFITCTLFIYDLDYSFPASSASEIFTSNANLTIKGTNEQTNDLSTALNNSDIEFTYNSYYPSHSNGYEMTFALENMKTSGEISSYTTPTFLLDGSNLKEYSSNFSF